MAQFPRLSNREWDVLKLLLEGKSNKLIASSLGVSTRTIEFHLKNIYAKFQVSSRIELILKLGDATGRFESEKLGRSTVDDKWKVAENRDRPNSRMSWATSFRETVSIIGKELEMKNLLNSKHVRTGVITALFTGFAWVSLLLYAHHLSSDEIKVWTAPLIVVWAIIGLSVGLVGKRNGNTLRKVFSSALLGTGMGPVVFPVGQLLVWVTLIVPSTILTKDIASTLVMITMAIIWLVVGVVMGIVLLFVTIRKPEQAITQPHVSERGL
jgi:DNA-binding CsgD family transcriptional regulator